MTSTTKKITRRSLGVLLSVLMVITSITIALPTAYAAEDSTTETADTTECTISSVSVTYDGEETTAITVPQDERETLTGAVEATGDVTYQWQILADESTDTWANIYDGTEETLDVSYALTGSLMDESGSVYVRLKAIDEYENEVTSDSVKVTTAFVTGMSELTSNADKANEDSTDADTSDTFTVTINYYVGISGTVGEDGTTVTYTDFKHVYSSYKATYSSSSGSVTVNSPTYVGYTAYCTNENVISDSTPSQNGYAAASANDKAESITYNVSEDTVYNVYYAPEKVQYTVEYYTQNINNNEYTKEETATYTSTALTGTTLTGAEVNEGFTSVVEDADGYSALYYVPTEVAGDGSTVIQSYYDRNYYLFTFKLDGGYGTDPVYARYGTSFTVNEPTRSGYIFRGWDFQSATDTDGKDVTDDVLETFATSGDAADGEADTVPTSMPLYNCVYQAVWEQDNTSFTVAYWKQNADDDEYTYWGSRTVDAMSGDKITLAETTSTTDEAGNEVTKKTGHYYNNIDITQITEAMQKESEENYINKTETTEYYKRFEYDEKQTEKTTEQVAVYDDNGNKTDVIDQEVDRTYTIAGDGSTVVNIYYARKTYTLRIIYAKSIAYDKEGDMEKAGVVGTEGEQVYFVYGDDTKNFGTGSGGINTNLSPVNCGDQDGDNDVDDDDYLIYNLQNSGTINNQSRSGESKPWGVLTEKPTLKDEYKDKFTTGEIEVESTNSYVSNKGYKWTYYYIEIKGRYGCDISDKFTGELFNPVGLQSNSKSRKSGKTYNYAYYASVNGEYFTRYSQDNNGNQTIKGTYTRLDDDLLFKVLEKDSDGNYVSDDDGENLAPKDFTTVSFLAAWENGCNSVSWNVPCEWIYKYYVQSVDNAETNVKIDPSDKSLADLYFNETQLLTSYRIGDNHSNTGKVYSSGTWNEKPTALEGFTFVADVDGYSYKDSYRLEVPGTDKATKSYVDDGKYKTTTKYYEGTEYEEEIDSYTVHFYYLRNTYKLKFRNYGTYVDWSTEQTDEKDGLLSYVEGVSSDGETHTDSDDKASYVNVYYEKELKSLAAYEPVYPSSLEPGAYKFVGWYTSPTHKESTKVDLSSYEMPAHDVTLYAKWVPIEHSVRIFDSIENLEAFQKASVTDDEDLIYQLDQLDSVTRETNDDWIEAVAAKEPYAKSTDETTGETTAEYKVTNNEETRIYKSVTDSDGNTTYYRVSTEETDEDWIAILKNVPEDDGTASPGDTNVWIDTDASGSNENWLATVTRTVENADGTTTTETRKYKKMTVTDENTGKTTTYYYNTRYNNTLFEVTSTSTGDEATETPTRYIYVDSDVNGNSGYILATGILDVEHETHGEVVGSVIKETDLKDPTNEDRIFKGWRYEKSDGSTTAFALLSTAITADMDVYAEWSSQSNAPYVVHYAKADPVSAAVLAEINYYEENQNPANNQTCTVDGITYVYQTSDLSWHQEIADDTTGELFSSVSKTFEPKTGVKDLYEEFSTNYYPTVASHTINVVDTDDPLDNSYTFLYVYVKNLTYTVKYVFNNEAQTLMSAHDEDFSGVSCVVECDSHGSSVVTERFKSFDGYEVDKVYKTAVLSAVYNSVTGEWESDTENNVIVFKYTEGTGYPYTIHYLLQNADGRTYTEDTNYQESGTVAQLESYMVMYEYKTIAGYEFSKAMQGTSSDAIKATTELTPGTDSAGNPAVNITVEKDGTDVFLYYDIQKYGYRIYYLAYGTTYTASKSNDGSLTDTDGNALSTLFKTDDYTDETYKDDYWKTYGSALAVSVPKGHETYTDDTYTTYTVMEATVSITIGSSGKNNIVFYYMPNEYTVEYKVAEGSEDYGDVTLGMETVKYTESDGTYSYGSFSGSTATKTTEATGVKFAGWYTDEACTQKVTYYASEDDAIAAGAKAYLVDEDGTKIMPVRKNLTANNTNGQTSTIFYAKFSRTAIEFNTNYATYSIKNQAGTAVLDSTAWRTYVIPDDTENDAGVYDMTEQTDSEGNTTYSIEKFYDTPSEHVNNDWVFAGWYDDPEDEDNAYDWDEGTTYSDDGTTETWYAHWIKVGTVDKDDDDQKTTGSKTYSGFDLFGAQIRNSLDDPNHQDKSGNTTTDKDGLRFVTTLSETLLEKLYNLSDTSDGAGENSNVGYGFLLANANTVTKENGNYKVDNLLYPSSNEGGTYSGYCGTGSTGYTTDGQNYKKVKAYDCTSKQVIGKSTSTKKLKGNVDYDHFNNKDYRIYSLLVQYKTDTNKTVDLIARAYICYKDANGLTRYYYNDYTGTNTLGGVKTNYNDVYDAVKAGIAKDEDEQSPSIYVATTTEATEAAEDTTTTDTTEATTATDPTETTTESTTENESSTEGSSESSNSSA